MKKRTLTFKLVAGGILAVFIPLVVVGVFASMKASSALDSAMRERVVKGAAKLVDLVQESLSQEIKLSRNYLLTVKRSRLRRPEM